MFIASWRPRRNEAFVRKQAVARIASTVRMVLPHRTPVNRSFWRLPAVQESDLLPFDLAPRPTGTADLPLHAGRVPRWLAQRMARLGNIVLEALVLQDGTDGVLERLSHPFWFQALGNVMGMDWHSSGITTSVLGALKRGIAGSESELGLWICGGRGKASLKTPSELRAMAGRTGLDGESLVSTSRLVAKVDNAAVQDGFQIYIHGFIVDRGGGWTVVQQGLSPSLGTARRYHWTHRGLRSFVDEPHRAIEGSSVGTVLNLTDRNADTTRDTILDLVKDGYSAFLDSIRQARRLAPRLSLPARHDVRSEDVVPHRLAAAFEAGQDASNFEELLLTPGLGPRALGSLALIAETLHGRPARFSDPARFSFAHGGKDGHPFPVQTAVYDETLRVLRRAVERAKLGRDEQMEALRRLDREARRVEAILARPESGVGPHTVRWFIERQLRASPRLGGRIASGKASSKPRQLVLGLRPAGTSGRNDSGEGDGRHPGQSHEDGECAGGHQGPRNPRGSTDHGCSHEGEGGHGHDSTEQVRAEISEARFDAESQSWKRSE